MLKMKLWTETRLAPGHPLPQSLHPRLPGLPASSSQYAPPPNSGYPYTPHHNVIAHPGPVALIRLDPGLVFPLTPMPKRLLAPRQTEVPLPLDVMPALLRPPPSITPSPSQLPLAAPPPPLAPPIRLRPWPNVVKVPTHPSLPRAAFAP